jgi:hypothetical protein
MLRRSERLSENGWNVRVEAEVLAAVTHGYSVPPVHDCDEASAFVLVRVRLASSTTASHIRVAVCQSVRSAKISHVPELARHLIGDRRNCAVTTLTACAVPNPEPRNRCNPLRASR